MPDQIDALANATADLAEVRTLCASVAACHGGTLDCDNPQIILNYRTHEEARAAWAALAVMERI